jgi:hypothetical protein
MGFLLHGNRVTVMKKKLTNSDPFIQLTRKHSIYTCMVRMKTLSGTVGVLDELWVVLDAFGQFPDDVDEFAHGRI